MGKSSKMPAPPDPMATANAQAEVSRRTAMTQQQMNMVDQVTPDGSLSYTQNGTWPDGTPRFTATTALTPGQQGIYDTNQQTQANIAGIGRDQSSRIAGLLGTPLKLGNEATEARLMDLGMARLNPQFTRNQEALRTRLVNSGIREGSAAWNAEMGRNSQAENDAVNQLLLSGRAQANQELMTERNQPINEVNALMSSSQVSDPTFRNTPTANVATPDYAGLVQSNYNAQVQQQQMKQQQQNAILGGLFGLGAAGVYKWSDRRLKKNIKKIGKTNDGQNLYRYEYKGSDKPEIGLMAQEVEKKKPDAVVTTATGFKAVDYDRALGLMSA